MADSKDRLNNGSNPWRSRILLLAAGAMPLLFGISLSWHAAQATQMQEAERAAQFLHVHVKEIMDRTRGVLRQIAAISAQPCEKIAPELLLAATLTPYIRSISVVEKGTVVCSSLTGPKSRHLNRIKEVQSELPSTFWSKTLTGTSTVPGQSALLLSEPGQQGRSVITTVDNQYLLDILHAVTPLDVFRESYLRVGQGTPLHQTIAGVPDNDTSILVDTTSEVSDIPVQVRIYGKPSRFHQIWRQLLMFFLPLTLVLSGVLMSLCRHLQQNYFSERHQLLRAIRRREFHVEYQPLYGVASGRCEGAEVLLRWNQPGTGPVRPDVFIALAEEQQAIIPLTQHLLDIVANDLETMGLLPDFHLGINFAPEHLAQEDFPQEIRAFAARVARCQPQIVLEVTERSLIRNTEQARHNLEVLRAEGIRVAIDDFGTGYCALSYLQKFPFDILKVDQGFVQTVDPEGEAVVLDTIIELGHRLDAQLIAEGVDKLEQFSHLAERGVGYIQGYLFAGPMNARQFARWYRTAGQQMTVPLPRAAAPITEGAENRPRKPD